MSEIIRGNYEVKFDGSLVKLTMSNGLFSRTYLFDRDEEKHQYLIGLLDDYLDSQDLYFGINEFKSFPDEINS